jgi:transposase
VTRALAEHPDRIIAATLTACPHCEHALRPVDLPDIRADDHIDLPLIRPITTRINRHRGACRCCRKDVTAKAPKGFEPGSPFGPGIEALLLPLHITQAVSFERFARMMAEVFGLTISEGAIANIRARAQPPLVAAADKIAAVVRASPVVGSDETSARVRGKTQSAMGAAGFDGDLPCDRRHAGGLGRDHVPGGRATGPVGRRSLRRAVGPRRGAANVSGASSARRKLRYTPTPLKSVGIA